nr:hypothetical protein [Tanacetum cinerariifolium]
MTGPEPSIPTNKTTKKETPNQNTTDQSIIEGHLSALKELLKEPGEKQRKGGRDKPKDKGKAAAIDDDLRKPSKEVLKCPFTKRIIEFSAPGHRLPTNAKIYDGTCDLKDHITRFTGMGNQREWPMSVWCWMFQQTQDGKARVWFDKLLLDSIDNWGDLQEKFLNRFGMLKACAKDPMKISKIVRRASETLPSFKERWVSESNAIPNVPELMQISSYMSSHKCPELSKRFSDNIPKTIEKNAQEGGRLCSVRRSFPQHIVAKRRVPAERRGQTIALPTAIKAAIHHMWLYTAHNKTPRRKEQYRDNRAVLTLDSLSYLGVLQNGPQKGKVINMVNCVAKDRNRKSIMTDEDWMNVPIVFPLIRTRDLSKEVVMVEAEVEGYLVRRIHVDEGASIKIMFSGEQVKALGKIELDKSGEEANGGTVKKESKSQEDIGLTEAVLVNPAHPDQLVTISKNLSLEGATQLKNLLKNNKDIFAWEPSNMTRVPKRIIKHTLNANPSVTPVSQKRKVFSVKKSQVVTQKVAEWLKAGIVRPIKYPTWISNLVLVKKVDESWRMCIDFKNINSACPKDYYPLLKIDRKIDSVLGFPFKFSVVLVAERKGRQCPMHYVSRTLHDAERNYAPLEKIALALLHTSRRLKRYFEAHDITGITDQPVKQILNKAEASGKLAKYSVELGAYNFTFETRNAIKGQILADFINEVSVGSESMVPRATSYTVNYQKDGEEEWVLYTDRSSSVKGSGVDLVLISPTKTEYTYAMWLNFARTNNQAEYGALLAGLKIAKKMKVQSLSVNVDTKLVASQINGSYVAYQESMIQYLSKAKNIQSPHHRNISGSVRNIINRIEGSQCSSRGGGDNWINPIIKCLSEGKWPKDTNEERTICMKINQYMMEEGVLFKREEISRCDSCQIHAPVPKLPKTLMTSTMAPCPFFQWGMDVLRPLPEALRKVNFVIVAVDYFTKWIEAKPLAKAKGKEVKKFVWDNIVCSLTFSSEALIPGKIGMPTYRTMTIKEGTLNEEEIWLNLDLLQERREPTAIREPTKSVTEPKGFGKRPVEFGLAYTGMFGNIYIGQWYMLSLWEVGKASPYRGVSRQSLRSEAHGLSIDKIRRREIPSYVIREYLTSIKESQGRLQRPSTFVVPFDPAFPSVLSFLKPDYSFPSFTDPVRRCLKWWSDNSGRPATKGVGLRVADSRIGNHPEDYFTPLETIQRLCSVFGRRSYLGFERETSEPKGRGMAWRHHDSSATDTFPKSNEYNKQDAFKLREAVVTLHNPYNSLLYVAGLSLVWKEAGHVPILKGPKGKETHLSTPATRLEDIPPKTGAIETIEVACRKVIADREKKKRKTKATIVARAKGDDDVESDAGSDQVSSPIPLNQSLPITLVNKKNVSETPFAAWLATLRNQIDEQGYLLDLVKGNESLLRVARKKPMRVQAFLDAEASYSAGRFGNLPFTPQWGLTDYSRMALTKEHADLVQAHESCKDVKTHYKECKKEFAKIQSAYDETVSAYDQLSNNYDGALTRVKNLQDRLEEMEKEKKETEEKYVVEAGKGKCLVVGKGFIDGLYVGRKDEDVQAILKDTPGVDPTSSDTFMGEYNKLFDKRYPYVDKVTRSYLHDPTGLQNVMPDGTGPTPGQGPRDTPTASYA